MRRNSVRILAWTLLIICVSIAMTLAWLLWPWRPCITIATDPLYRRQVLDFPQTVRLTYRFAREGFAFRVIEVDLANVSDAQKAADAIAQDLGTQAGMLLISPVLSRTLADAPDFFFPDTTGDLLVIGIGNDLPFDVSLVRQLPDPAWTYVGAHLVGVVRDNPLPSALLYDANDKQAVGDALLFASAFSGVPLETVVLGESSDRTVEETMAKLSGRHVMLVVVPHVNMLDRFVTSSHADGMRWVVDSTHASVVPPEALEGILVDDLFASIRPLFGEDSPGEKRVLPLVREYRRHR